MSHPDRSRYSVTTNQNPIGKIHVFATTSSEKRRPRTIRAAILYLIGLVILLAILPMPARVLEAACWISLAACLIGIAALLRMWWIGPNVTPGQKGEGVSRVA